MEIVKIAGGNHVTMGQRIPIRVITIRCTRSRGPRGFFCLQDVRRGPVNVDVIRLSLLMARTVKLSRQVGTGPMREFVVTLLDDPPERVEAVAFFPHSNGQYVLRPRFRRKLTPCVQRRHKVIST